MDGQALWRWQHASAKAHKLHVEPADVRAIPGWLDDDHCAAFDCYLHAAAAGGKLLPPADAIPGLRQNLVEARTFFETHFEAFRIIGEPGLLTAYFEPQLLGSRTREAGFGVPVYRRPADLAPLPADHPLIEAGLTAARKTAQGFQPYAVRAEIEAGALAGRGLELLYLQNPIEAFVMHVQGSGRVQFADGTVTRLSFDGKNGQPYTSISKLLIERGALAPEDAHLEGLLGFLSAHPEPQAVLSENKSYIFFKALEESAAGPIGSSGTGLLAGRSLAIDPLYHAFGTPIWVEAPALSFEGASFGRLLIAQDSGSAIVGPQRGDVFAGMGAEAGRVAGRIRHSCKFIVLRPKR